MIGTVIGLEGKGGDTELFLEKCYLATNHTPGEYLTQSTLVSSSVGYGTTGNALYDCLADTWGIDFEYLELSCDEWNAGNVSYASIMTYSTLTPILLPQHFDFGLVLTVYRVRSVDLVHDVGCRDFSCIGVDFASAVAHCTTLLS